jgi:hypothetical protein
MYFYFLLKLWLVHNKQVGSWNAGIELLLFHYTVLMKLALHALRAYVTYGLQNNYNNPKDKL